MDEAAWDYLLTYLFPLAPASEASFADFTRRCLLLTDHPAWRDCQLLWGYEGLESPGAFDPSFLCGLLQRPLVQQQSVRPARVGPDWMFLVPNSDQSLEESWWPKRQVQWVQSLQNKGIRQKGGLLSNFLMAGVDGGTAPLEQLGGLLSDTQVLTICEGEHAVRQSGGWGDDDQTVVVEGGRTEILQRGGRGTDHQLVELRGGQHKVHQIGGAGDDLQCVIVKGETEASVVLQGGTGSDVQEVILEGSGRNFVEIEGGEGSDCLKVSGGHGVDDICLRGGAGDDLFVYRVGSGQATVRIEGGSGTDKVVVYLQGHGVEIFEFAGEQIGLRQIFSDSGIHEHPIRTRIELRELQRCRIVWHDFRHQDLELGS